MDLDWCLRRIVWITSSSCCKNRDRSRFFSGGGPPVIFPAPRSSDNRSLVATAWPMLFSENGFPVGPITRALSFMQRLASRISAVTTMSWGCTWLTIQSSAASNQSSTTSSAIHSSFGIRIQELATNVTSRLYRPATRYTFCLTGQTSASTKICSKQRPSHYHVIIASVSSWYWTCFFSFLLLTISTFIFSVIRPTLLYLEILNSFPISFRESHLSNLVK